jgi:hypothetical protein
LRRSRHPWFVGDFEALAQEVSLIFGDGLLPGFVTRPGRGLDRPGRSRRRLPTTDGLRRTLTATGLALAGRAGGRLVAALGMITSRSSLLRPLPDPLERPVPVLGVDDIAIKNARTTAPS